ncbi:hypothetical protein [Acidithiobacillus ferrooxidans]|uniref:hypothetical protein n=1 Tax=Acidithiobacillus ferrooxidans TaxID=920 RepID=UPI000A892C56|nr:hypothetical protein [Acidithiobacillus ferrooxidans]
MAKFEECIIYRSVTVTVDGQSRKGTIVGRRYNNNIEGYITPTNNFRHVPEQEDDMVQIAFLLDSTIPDDKYVTTGLLCKPERVVISSGPPEIQSA